MSVQLTSINKEVRSQQQQREEEEEDNGSSNIDNDRDARFRKILRQTFGRNGLTIIAIFAMILMITILLVFVISFSYTSTIKDANKNSHLLSVVVAQQKEKGDGPILRLSRPEPILQEKNVSPL